MEPLQRLVGQILGRAFRLQQLRHHKLFTQNIGQTYPGLQPLAFDDLPRKLVHVVSNDHGFFKECRFKRGGPTGHQGHITSGQACVRSTHQEGAKGVHVCLTQKRLNMRHRKGRGGQHKAQFRFDFVHVLGGQNKPSRHVLNLTLTTPWQQRHQGTLCLQPQRFSGLDGIGFVCDDLGQGVTHKSRLNAVLRQELGLKGKQTQDMVHAFRNAVHPFGPPSPNGGTHELNTQNPFAL